MKEIKKLMKKPLDDIEIMPKNNNLQILTAFINGPQSTAFENGRFQIELHFDNNYPSSPPKGYFVTKIFHPNVAPSNGEICVNTLKKEWKSSYGIKDILIVIRCLLIEPNPDSALNEEAGKLLRTSYSSYVQRAKLFTKIHSIPIHDKKKKIEDEDGLNKNDDDSNKNGGDKENLNEQKKENDKDNEILDECLNEKENNGKIKYDENNQNNKRQKNKSKSKGKSKKKKKSKVSKSMRRL